MQPEPLNPASLPIATGSPDLLEAELRLLGRIRIASNATFVASIGEATVVYKPSAGERPLWDFPEGRLAEREVAAYLISEQLGWNLVPPTWLRDGPHGPGMVQLWCAGDPTQEPVTLVAEDRVPPGWCHILDGMDDQGRNVSLIHEDSLALRRIAIFDALVNNADRKGGHILAMSDRHRFGCDHGLTFHTEPKLRTVLWGWIGSPLSDDERAAVTALRDQLIAQASDANHVPLASLITEAELAALIGRCDALGGEGVFPEADGEMPAVPWPPF